MSPGPKLLLRFLGVFLRHCLDPSLNMQVHAVQNTFILAQSSIKASREQRCQQRGRLPGRQRAGGVARPDPPASTRATENTLKKRYRRGMAAHTFASDAAPGGPAAPRAGGQSCGGGRRASTHPARCPCGSRPGWNPPLPPLQTLHPPAGRLGTAAKLRSSLLPANGEARETSRWRLAVRRRP